VHGGTLPGLACAHTRRPSGEASMQQSKEDLIRLLGLIPHADYGFFRETYRSGAAPMSSRGQTDLAGDIFDAKGIQGPSQEFWQSQRSPADAARVPRNIMTSIYFMVTSGAHCPLFNTVRCSLVMHDASLRVVCLLLYTLMASTGLEVVHNTLVRGEGGV
jgi:predicted cupin superfamily sugar epimerase